MVNKQYICELLMLMVCRNGLVRTEKTKDKLEMSRPNVGSKKGDENVLPHFFSFLLLFSASVDFVI